MADDLRVFGVKDVDEYWANREREQSTGEGRLHRFLAALIDRMTGPEGKVLDCGCGAGHVFRLCHRTHRMYAVELSPRAIASYDFPTDTIRQADLNRGIPDFAVRFDVILASMILHWLDRPAEFLTQATGTLAPGGRLIVVIPNITYYRFRIAYLFGRFPPISRSHRNFQTPAEFERMARTCHWRIQKRLSPKRTLRARLWPTVFSQDMVYVLQSEA